MLHLLVWLIPITTPIIVWSQSSLVSHSLFNTNHCESTSSQVVLKSTMGFIFIGNAQDDSTRLQSGCCNFVRQEEPELAVDGFGADNLPAAFALRQNYPNPFNPTTIIQFDLPVKTEVSLIIYNQLGREVAGLLHESMEPGYHQVRWHARTASGRVLPSGIYIASLVTPEFRKTIKMVLVR